MATLDTYRYLWRAHSGLMRAAESIVAESAACLSEDERADLRATLAVGDLPVSVVLGEAPDLPDYHHDITIVAACYSAAWRAALGVLS